VIFDGDGRSDLPRCFRRESQERNRPEQEPGFRRRRGGVSPARRRRRHQPGQYFLRYPDKPSARITTALAPYVADEKLLEHCPTVLHLSLRDLCVNVILASQNVVDDVDHCLKASTSLHLTEMATGNRDFVAGNLVDVLEKKVEPDRSRPRIFSPFGLGVLDLAVGSFVLEAAISSNATIAISDFFSNSTRW
jgi:hypothetical protein